MRLILAILLFVGFAGSANADGFGQRFGNEPPFALRDTLDPTTVVNIQPAAGDEDQAVEEEVETDEAVADSEEEVTEDEAGLDTHEGAEAEETEDLQEQEENQNTESLGDGLIRVYPEPIKK